MASLGSVKCPDGFYNNLKTDASTCEPCKEGYYCKNLMTGLAPMSPHPIPCPKGTYSPIGVDQCIGCPVGTYCPLEGTTET